MRKFDCSSWSRKIVTLPNGKETTLLILFIGGMEKEDYQKLVEEAEDKQALIKARALAGDQLTMLGITPRNATMTLINLGYRAYMNGNREDWAMYAYYKVNRKTGCLIKVFIVIALAVLYLIFS